MTMSRFLNFIFRFISTVFILPKRIMFFIVSENKICRLKGVKILSPSITTGKGVITFGKGSIIGVMNSPRYFSSYNYFDSRSSSSVISIGKNCIINNNVSIISEFTNIDIGDDVLIGFDVNIVDSDFHQLEKDKRRTGIPKSKSIKICNNVFIGSNVSILKGVSIGENSVIGMGAVVVNDIPPNSIAAGNPAKVIRNI